LEIREDKKSDKQPLFQNYLSRLIALLACLAIAIIGCWLGYLIYKWLINKLFLWSPIIGLIGTAISLIWCIVAIILYQIYTKIFLYEDKDEKASRLDDFIGYLIFFGRDLSAFFFYFISFAYLCWEVQLILGQQFAGETVSVNAYIAFAFENAIDIVESDILDIFEIKLSDIKPIGFIGKNLVFFFRLFIKLVIIGFVIRIIRYLFHAD